MNVNASYLYTRYALIKTDSCVIAHLYVTSLSSNARVTDKNNRCWT